VLARQDWTERVLGKDRERCPSAGEEWLRDAQFEHASIAAFSAFALTLTALGAPPDLLDACSAATRDEIEHARRCFELASHHLGRRLGPGPLDLSGLEIESDLERAALMTFVDGCIGETIAALTARAQLEVASDPVARATLARIAEDETRHAEFAWKFVAWTVAQRGPSLVEALERALGDAAERFHDETPDCDDVAAWHRAGRLLREERLEIAREAFATVLPRGLEELRRAPLAA
jgi:hypothetical protein